jgi:ABC-type sugar transport system substrate-binding protein
MMMNRGCGRFLMIVSLIATILAFAQLAVASDDQNFGINIDLSNSYFGTILKERSIRTRSRTHKCVNRVPSEFGYE